MRFRPPGGRPTRVSIHMSNPCHDCPAPTPRRIVGGGMIQWALVMAISLMTAGPWALGQATDSSGPADDGTRTSPALRQAFAEACAAASRATVSVVVGGRQAALGVIVSNEGHVLTKASELRGPISVRLGDGRLVGAQLVGTALEHDLAMIQLVAGPAPALITVPAGASTQQAAPRPPLPATAPASVLGSLTPIRFDTGDDPPVGTWVAAAGPASPTPLAVGVIGVARRTIPADVIMGVILQNHTRGGARVAEVSPRGGAARAGVKIDDVIVAIDDQPVATREDVTSLLARKSPGQTAVVRVRRDDQTINLEVGLSLRPAPSARSARQNRMGGRLSDRRTGFAAVLQHDMVTLDPSQCGSPVVTLDGRVVGLNIARAGRTEVYALPAGVVRALIADLRAGRYPPTTNPSVEPSTRPAATGPSADVP